MHLSLSACIRPGRWALLDVGRAAGRAEGRAAIHACGAGRNSVSRVIGKGLDRFARV